MEYSGVIATQCEFVNRACGYKLRPLLLHDLRRETIVYEMIMAARYEVAGSCYAVRHLDWPVGSYKRRTPSSLNHPFTWPGTRWNQKLPTEPTEPRLRWRAHMTNGALFPFSLHHPLCTLPTYARYFALCFARNYDALRGDWVTGATVSMKRRCRSLAFIYGLFLFIDTFHWSFGNFLLERWLKYLFVLV